MDFWKTLRAYTLKMFLSIQRT